jgi:hypothetical protein
MRQDCEGVKVFREGKVYQRNGERIPGDGEFVGRVLASAEEAMEKRFALRAIGCFGRVRYPLGDRLTVGGALCSVQ